MVASRRLCVVGPNVRQERRAKGREAEFWNVCSMEGLGVTALRFAQLFDCEILLDGACYFTRAGDGWNVTGTLDNDQFACRE